MDQPLICRDRLIETALELDSDSAEPVHSIVLLARDWAHRGHDSVNQKRKYTGDPYWVHTDEVEALVRAAGAPSYVQAAADIHDYFEDVSGNMSAIAEARGLLGDQITLIALELTDLYTPENFPSLNRATRKGKEARRLGMASTEAQIIKCADFISNTKTIVEYDPGFARTYLSEKMMALSSMSGGTSRPSLMPVFQKLHNDAALSMEAAYRTLNA